MAVCHSFSLFFIFSNIHTIIQSYPYNTLAEASLHLLITCKLSGTDLPVVPSRESNSGLPSSKPTRYQLCHILSSLNCRKTSSSTTMDAMEKRKRCACHQKLNSTDCEWAGQPPPPPPPRQPVEISHTSPTQQYSMGPG